MSEKFFWSKPCDQTKWEADIGEPIMECSSPEEAQAVARAANRGELVILPLYKKLRGSPPKAKAPDK